MRAFMIALTFASFIALFFAGCAPILLANQDQQNAFWLPPGMTELPPASAMLSARSVRLLEGPGWLVHYRLEGKTVGVLWIDGEPVVIDPDSADKAVPVWVRTRRDPCTWRSEIVGALRA